MAIASRARRTERAVVVGYLGAALLAGLVVLPSILRPPQQEQQTGAAFSPDAPPDENAQSIFSAFGAASSGTPSGVDLIDAGVPALELPPPTTEPPPIMKPNACPYGFGAPVRQIESIYAPPCSPAFVGDNGGATARGVTATHINVCILTDLVGGTSDGEVPPQTDPSDSTARRTYRGFMSYFNSRLQLHGRQLRFFWVSRDGGGAEADRARAQKAVTKYNCFAALQETNTNEISELAAQKVITFTFAEMPERSFAKLHPYMWSFNPSATRMVEMGVEYACKKLAGGKHPVYTRHPAGRAQTFEGKPRKWGIISYNNPAYTGNGEDAQRQLKETCGIDAMLVNYDIDDGSTGNNNAGYASAVTQLAAGGVSTVFFLGDLLIGAPVFTQIASSNDYYPEWFLPGFGGVDTGHIARAYSPEQWDHAWGFSFFEVPRPESDTECFKAYRDVDPDNEPDATMCFYLWQNMVQLFGGMQRTGPKLTVPALVNTFLTQPRLPPEPPWHMAGGFSPNDHTFADWASEIWWDRNARGSDGLAGTYRFPNKGKRYFYGQWPAGDGGVFREGIALASEASEPSS